MSDALTPLRHAYGVEPAGPVPASGEPGHAEWTLLRQMRTALDALPPSRPEAAAVEAVLAHADPLAAVRAAYDPEADAPASAEYALLRSTSEALDHVARLGDRAPAADAVQAVLARAAEATAQPTEPRLGAGASPAEAAVLASTLDALDRLPTSRPDADTVARVLAHAEAAHPLAAVRAVYADGPAPATTVEAELLRQSGTILDRALRTRPQPRPSEAAVEAVLVRAAEATGLSAEIGVPEAASVVESDLLDQSLRALDRLPSARPEADTVAAVLARAAEATPSARPAHRAPDRTAARPARTRRTGVWAGVGGLLVAVLVAVAALPRLFVSEPSVAPEAAQFVASDTRSAEDVTEAEPAANLAEAEPEATPPPSTSAALAAAAALTTAIPSVTRTPTASGPSTPQPGPAVQFAARVADVAEAGPPPSWDAGDDVRTLSLRLRELDRETQGLAWDPPLEVGAPAAVSSGATPGLQVVREGAVPPPPVRPDSTRQQR